MRPSTILTGIRLAHTLVWAVFAGAIVALPIAAWRGDFRMAGILIGLVLVEVLVLVVNGWVCPMTPLAARYTDERAPNFDIYLPRWLAQHNKTVFGALFVVGLVYTAVRWLGWIG